MQKSSIYSFESEQKRVQRLFSHTILPFWLDHIRNRSNGGFHGKFSRNGTPVADTPRGVVQHGRLLWSFSSFFEFTSDDRWQPLVRDARLMLLKFFDDKHSGFFYLLAPDSQPLCKDKYIYGQSFALYGLARYARIFDCQPTEKLAMDLFHKLIQFASDHKYGGFIEAFSQNWQPIEQHEDFGISGFRKTMNCHIHLVEAFTELYRTSPERRVAEAGKNLIDCILFKIYDEKRKSLSLYFEPDWTRIDRIHSFGHDIETAWLLLEASETFGRYRSQDVRETALALIDQVLDLGLDRQHCGVFYEMEQVNGAADFDQKKVWWVQAEAMVGFLKAYQITRNQRYFDALINVLDWIENHQVDPLYGEWFYEIAADGTVHGEKAGLWKTPYHNGRACMEADQILTQLLKNGRSSHE